MWFLPLKAVPFPLLGAPASTHPLVTAGCETERSNKASCVCINLVSWFSLGVATGQDQRPRGSLAQQLHVHYYSKEGKLEKFSFPEGAGGDMMINRQVICGVGGWREEDPGIEMVS